MGQLNKVSPQFTIGKFMTERALVILFFVGRFQRIILAGSGIWPHVFIVLRLRCTKDVAKFTLWRNVSSEKLGMLQERSDSLTQSFPRIQQRSEATKNSVTATLQIDFLTSTSRSAVCCHKSAALFTQTYRFSQVVTGKAFLGWESYGISWWTACKRKRVM